MRDQDIDERCFTDEDDVEQPMAVRYGVTAFEASHHEPLDLALRQEEPEPNELGIDPWGEVDLPSPLPRRTRTVEGEEPADALSAEVEAMHEQVG